MGKPLIDIVILTYKPDSRLFDLLERLKDQTIPATKIIIMNTEEKYLRNLLYGTRFLDNNPNVEIHHLSKLEFDHGRTRNKAAEYSSAIYILFMTQDALPLDSHLISELLSPMKNPEVAVSYARQVASDTASPIEKYNRIFNYPEEDRLQNSGTLYETGIKTYFCSDVCACYRKKDFEEQGGFISPAIFNEDMIFAAEAVKRGKSIYYASKALVQHSHDYTASQQFHRNFDLGVSQANYPGIFDSLPVGKEGGKLVRGCINYLISQGKFYLIPKFLIHCMARYRGFKLGKKYTRLKRKAILKYTMNPEYWKRYWDLTDVPDNLEAGYGKNAEGL